MNVENPPSVADQILNQGLEPDSGGQPTPKTPAPRQEAPKAPEPKEPLELGSDEAPRASDDDLQAEHERTRSRPWSKRVDILTARLRQAEERIAQLTGGNGGQTQGQTAPQGPTAPAIEAKKPKPEDFEFGAADPAYTDALTDWKLELRDAQARDTATAERSEAEKANAIVAARREAANVVSEGAANLEKKATEKYPDFKEAIDNALDARGGQSLPPLIGVGLSLSPVGHDLAYRLAKDTAVSDRLEQLANTNVQSAALMFGELEGEYLEDDGDSDLNVADPIDFLRLQGRERARRKGAGEARRRAQEEAEAAEAESRITRAPKPAERAARGGTGKTEVDDSTDDFAAFERKHMRKRNR